MMPMRFHRNIHALLAPALLSRTSEFTDSGPVCAGHGTVQRAATRVAQWVFCGNDFVRGCGEGAVRFRSKTSRGEIAAHSLWQPDRFGGRAGEKVWQGID